MLPEEKSTSRNPSKIFFFSSVEQQLITMHTLEIAVCYEIHFLLFYIKT